MTDYGRRRKAIERLIDESSVPEVLEDIAAVCVIKSRDISDNGDNEFFTESKIIYSAVRQMEGL